MNVTRKTKSPAGWRGMVLQPGLVFAAFRKLRSILAPKLFCVVAIFVGAFSVLVGHPFVMQANRLAAKPANICRIPSKLFRCHGATIRLT